MTLDQLKIHAYECLKSIEKWQREYQLTEQAIQNFRPVITPEEREELIIKEHE